jgi:DNA invertase Pin-like site-specific DNA recombinase
MANAKGSAEARLPAPAQGHSAWPSPVLHKLNRAAEFDHVALGVIRKVVDQLGQVPSHVGEFAWCDTTTDVGRLMLTIMGGIAEFERGLIRKRCEEGIARAKRKGTKFGRPTALDPGQRRRIAERYSAGETMAALAREYDCGEAAMWCALQ